MGGGTLLIPLLTLFTDTEQHVAQLYNLTAFIPMALISIFIHSKNGLIEKKGILPVILSAAVGSVAGSFIAAFTGGGTLRKIFGFFLTGLAVFLIVKQIKIFFKKGRKR